MSATETDPVREVREQLTGPGGPFEIVREEIDGHDLKVFEDGLPNLRIVAQFAEIECIDTLERVFLVDIDPDDVSRHSLSPKVRSFAELVADPTDEIRTWVAETLAPFKVPTHLERWAGRLPRNTSGKLLKNILRGEGHVSFAETM